MCVSGSSVDTHRGRRQRRASTPPPAPKYLLSCTDDNNSAADAAQLYKSLLEAERSFRAILLDHGLSPQITGGCNRLPRTPRRK